MKNDLISRTEAVEDDSPYLNCEEDYAYRKKKTEDAWNRRAE